MLKVRDRSIKSMKGEFLMTENKQLTESDLPAGLAKPAQRALLAAGYSQLSKSPKLVKWKS